MNGHDSKIQKLISLVHGKKVLFLSHVRPDLDTLASAMALTHFFLPHSQSTWGIVEPLNEFLQSQTAFFPIQPNEIESLGKFDCVVCVDFRSPSQAGLLSEAFRSYSGKIIIIDHHSPSPAEFSRVDFRLIKPHSIAAAQLVTQMGQFMHASFTKPVAGALAMGMITDSARFLVANTKTFSTFDFLLQKSGKSYEELLTRAVPVPFPSDRVAILHSLKHAKIISIGNYTLASVMLPHQTGFVASALIQLGHDIGVTASYSNDGLFASVRVSARAHSELGFDAMKVLLPFAQSHNATCGGHARAAQLNLPPYFSEQMVVDVLTKNLLACVRKNDPKATIRIY
jgi:nanoRNase/pAp phosphatase (c-di-AMP/oligoRNAs hydrolase)